MGGCRPAAARYRRARAQRGNGPVESDQRTLEDLAVLADTAPERRCARLLSSRVHCEASWRPREAWASASGAIPSTRRAPDLGDTWDRFDTGWVLEFFRTRFASRTPAAVPGRRVASPSR